VGVINRAQVPVVSVPMSPRIVPVLLVLTSCPAYAVVPDDEGDTSTTDDSIGPGPPGPPPTTTADPGTTDQTGSTTEQTTSSTTTTATATTTTAADTTGDTLDTTAAPPGCGDGEVNGAEECDEGHALNANSGKCTLDCKNNVCGDGHVEVGVEICDAGIDNSDFIYGGCDTQCTLTNFCGDGQVNGPEECDRGKNNGTGEKDSDMVPCTASCTHDSLLVFLSSVTYTAVELGGAYEANDRCGELAFAAMLPNHQNFKAWLSDKFSDPLESFDPPVPGLAYALKNGLRVADDRAQLLATGPLTGIAITETGATIYEDFVWTATGPDGQLLDDALDCDDWGSNSPLFKARVGLSGVDKADVVAWNQFKAQQQWTTAATFGCNNKYRIYCFEQ